MPLYSFGSGGGNNFANADLTLTGNRTHDLGLFGFQFYSSSRANVDFSLTDSGDFNWQGQSSGNHFTLNTSSSKYLKVTGGHPTAFMKLHSNTSGFSYIDFYSMYLRANNGGTDFMRIRNTGIAATYDDFGIGLGNTLPSARLHVQGDGSTSATTTLLVENSGGTDLFKIDDSGGFALGSGATYSDYRNISIGSGATATGISAIAIGDGATATIQEQIAIGLNANGGSGANIKNITIGDNTTNGQYGVAIGSSADGGQYSVAIGWNAEATSQGGVSVGYNTESSGNGTCIGNSSYANGYTTALGYKAKANTNQSGLAVGSGAISDAFGAMTFYTGYLTQTRTNSTGNSAEFYLGTNTIPTFRFGNTVDGWLNSTGNFGIGLTTGISEKLHVEGNIISSGQTYSSIQTTLTPTGTTENIDWNNGNFAVLDLSSATGDVTLTLSNAKAGASYFIKIIQGATARDVVFPSTVKFAGQTAPYTLDVTATNGAVDAVSLAFDGTDFIANFSQNHG